MHDAVPQPLESGVVTGPPSTDKESLLPQIYEGMFLLDNNVVREGWASAKALVTGTLEKYGGKIHTARRWDERRLCYPIDRKNRGTYLLAYYEMPIEGIAPMRREFDLSERVLRYLELAVDEIPEGEAELSAAESAADFVVPEPPPDDAPDVEATEEANPEEGEGSEAPGGDATGEAPAGETPAGETPAVETPADDSAETSSEPPAEASAGASAEASTGSASEVTEQAPKEEA